MIFESPAGIFWLEPVPFQLKPHTGRARPTDFILPEGYSTEEMVSPSQADMFMQCRRKWGFKYVEKRETPQTEAQIQGTKMHAELERWLLSATPPQNARMLKSGVLARFPPPQARGLRAERAFVFALNWIIPDDNLDEDLWIYGVDAADGKRGRVLFWGFKDAELLPERAARLLQVDGQGVVEAAGEEQFRQEEGLPLPTGGAVPVLGDAWHVYDLKTTADIASWAKVAGKAAVVSPDRDLRRDTQALVYALGAFAEAGVVAAHDPTFNPADLQVVLHWVYVQTRGANTSTTTGDKPGDDGVAFDFQRTMAAMVEKMPDVVELIEHRKKRSAKTLTVLSMPATPTACGAYGGCPFRTECNDVPPIAVATSIFAQKRLEAQHAETFSNGEKSPQEKRMTASSAIVEKARELAAKKAAAGGSAPPPKPATPAVPAAPAPAAPGSAAANAKAALAKFAKKPVVPAAPADAGTVHAPSAPHPRVPAPATPAAGGAASILAKVAAKKKEAEAAAAKAADAARATAKVDVDAVVAKTAAAAGVNPAITKVTLDVDGIEVPAEYWQSVTTKKWRGTITELGISFDEGETADGLVAVLLAMARKKIEQLAELEAGTAAEATAPEQAPEQPKKPRGRPKAAAAAASPEASAKAQVAKVVVPQDDARGFVLYLDVLPMKGDHLIDVETLLGPVRAQVEAAIGKNYRLLDYSEGARLFAAQLQEELQLTPPTGTFFASTRTLDKEVLDVLIRAAFPVYKGVF